MNRELAEDLIRNNSDLRQYHDGLISRLRSSIRIEARHLDREPEHQSSKFGGAPLVPEGFEWPSWDITELLNSNIARLEKHKCKNLRASKFIDEALLKMRTELNTPIRSLDFLAEIDLQETAPFQSELELPVTGRILFFYDVEKSPSGFDPADCGGWRVVYFDGDPPLNLSTNKSRFSARPCVLDFKEEVSFPNDFRHYGLELHIWKDGPYKELYNSIMPDARSLHRIGGYPDTIQNPMELQCQLVSHGIYCGDSSGYNDPRCALLEPGAADWQLLLQIDSDEEPGWMWGDVGRLYFWIRHEDLREINFGNVWCVQQCY